MRETGPPHQRAVAKNPKIAHIAQPVSVRRDAALPKRLAHDPQKGQTPRVGPREETGGAMTVTDRKTPNYGRRILWLGVFVVILFGGYSAGWFYLADQLVTRAKAAIA